MLCLFVKENQTHNPQSSYFNCMIFFACVWKIKQQQKIVFINLRIFLCDNISTLFLKRRYKVAIVFLRKSAQIVHIVEIKIFSIKGGLLAKKYLAIFFQGDFFFLAYYLVWVFCNFFLPTRGCGDRFFSLEISIRHLKIPCHFLTFLKNNFLTQNKLGITT